jgi:hypothetical protein
LFLAPEAMRISGSGKRGRAAANENPEQDQGVDIPDFYTSPTLRQGDLPEVAAALGVADIDIEAWLLSIDLPQLESLSTMVEKHKDKRYSKYDTLVNCYMPLVREFAALEVSGRSRFAAIGAIAGGPLFM